MTDNLSDLFDQINEDPSSEQTLLDSLVSDHSTPLRPGTIDKRIDDLEYQKRRLENKDRALDIGLKSKTSTILFVLLIIEIIAAFVLVFLQGFGIIHLSEAMLDITLSATLIQTAYMATIIITYLFPNKK